MSPASVQRYFYGWRAEGRRQAIIASRRGVAIPDVTGVDHRGHQQADRIGDNVPLAGADAEASFGTPAPIGRLHGELSSQNHLSEAFGLFPSIGVVMGTYSPQMGPEAAALRAAVVLWVRKQIAEPHLWFSFDRVAMRGSPHSMILCSDGRVCFLEFRPLGGPPSSVHQRMVGAGLRRLGYHYEVLRSVAQLCQVLKAASVQLAAGAEAAASAADAELQPGLERALRTRRVALKRRTTSIRPVSPAK